MNEEEFIETVRQEAPLESADAAEDVTMATLQTLGERITDGEASDLARDLPDELTGPLVEEPPGEAEPFSLDEFTSRVSDRAGVDESEVVAGSRAVATALSEASEEFETAREQLPPEFDVAFEPRGPATREEVLRTVQDRAGLDSKDAARDVASATLRTLGERLTAGEANDLARYLPGDLAEQLVPSDGKEDATEYSLDEFVRRVAEREGAGEDEARVHAHAVCSTLADAVSERELDAARKQLPDPFGAAFEPPGAGDGKDRSGNR